MLIVYLIAAVVKYPVFTHIVAGIVIISIYEVCVSAAP